MVGQVVHFPNGIEQCCVGCDKVIVPRRNFVLMHEEQFICTSLNPSSPVICCGAHRATVATFDTEEEAEKDLRLARIQGVRNSLTQELFQKEKGILRLKKVLMF